METSFHFALVQSVRLDFEIVPLHKDQIPLNSPSLMCGTLDLTTDFIYSIFSLIKTACIFLATQTTFAHFISSKNSISCKA